MVKSFFEIDFNKIWPVFSFFVFPKKDTNSWATMALSLICLF